MKVKRWIVTAVDFDVDGKCDSKARILATCKTRDEALNFITDDMREYVDNNSNEDSHLILNEQNMRVSNLLGCVGCEWNLEEVEIDIEKDDVIEIGNAAYTDGYDAGFKDGQHSVLET